MNKIRALDNQLGKLMDEYHYFVTCFCLPSVREQHINNLLSRIDYLTKFIIDLKEVEE